VEDDEDDDDSRDANYKPPHESESEEELPMSKGSHAISSLLGAVCDDFFLESDEESPTKSSPKKFRSPQRKGRPTAQSKFVMKKPPPGAPRHAIDAYEKACKDFYDAERKKKLHSPNQRPETDYSGNHHPTLRTMSEVEHSRLMKGHTFRSRDILLLRVKEEANLRGIGINVVKSDLHRFICQSHEDPNFVVTAYQSMKKGYQVKLCLVREMDHDPDWNGEIPGGKCHRCLPSLHITTQFKSISDCFA